MVVSVSGGSPRFLMSDSRSAMIFLKVRKSSSPFLTDCACRQVCAYLQFKLAQGQTAGVHCTAMIAVSVLSRALSQTATSSHSCMELALLNMTCPSQKCRVLY